MNTRNVNENRFLRHWLVSSLGAWPASVVACLLAGMPIAILASLIAQFDALEIVANGLMIIGLFVIPGMSTGYIVGDLQHKLMHDFLDWTFVDWVKFSSIGGFLGGLAVIFVNLFLSTYLPERVQWMICLPIFILPLSLMQWYLLGQSTRDAWMWILANLAGAIVFSGLLFSLQPIPFIQSSPFLLVMIGLLAAASPGIITGNVMLWLYERPISEWDDEDAELAPVYIEVRNRDDR